MLIRPSTNICPKDLTRDMRGFFNRLLEQMPKEISTAFALTAQNSLLPAP
jgi:hypothetical protein